MIIVMSIDGVLSEPGEPLPVSGSTIFGRRIYEYLRYSNAAIYMISEERNEEQVNNWLLREGFTDFIKLVTRENSTEEDVRAWKLGTLSSILGRGQHVAFYVDNDPHMVSAVASIGIPMLLAIDAWGTPGRGSVQFKDWGTLVESISEESLKSAIIKKQKSEAFNSEIL